MADIEMIPVDVRRFFDRHIIGKPDLVLTVKSIDPTINDGVSINIDGPFRQAQFTFPSGKKFDVLEPEYAVNREGANETNVHAHLPWKNLKFVRLGRIALDTIAHDIRIILYATEPPPSESKARGSELIWFYAFAKNHQELIVQLPLPTSATFSRTSPIKEIV